MKGFESSDDYKDDGVGDCEYSYGYDGQCQLRWHDGPSEWGQQFDAADGMVVGVAADFIKGELMFGVNGDWKDPSLSPVRCGRKEMMMPVFTR